MSTAHEQPQASAAPQGLLAIMANHVVAANLLMAFLIVGGLLLAPRVKQEVFPEFQLEIVNVQVAYPGASPAEVEQGVVLAVEEAVRSLDGVKRVTSVAAEGVGTVTVELELGTDTEQAQADIQSAINRITSLPQDAERPLVSLASNRQQTLVLMVYGDVGEAELRAVAANVRDRLLLEPGITLVELAGVRPLEISIEVSQQTLRRHGLSLPQVAQAVRAGSIELPAGAVRTDSGEILLRTTERRDLGSEFEDLVVLGSRGGTEVRLGELATVIDGFAETDEAAFYDGVRAAEIRVFRMGNASPIAISDTVRAFVDEHRDSLPAGIDLAVLNDSSEMFRERIQLLLKNAFFGLILVILVLGLFLELKLAIWVTMGIPICFFGALIFMPSLGVSINMISLFAFILVLGIVVDDAIVVGEAVYYRREKGMQGVDAAIAGVRDVATPVVFSVLTTMVAFVPLLFIPGATGKFMGVIPVIVILLLVLSLFESLLMLPAHLAHGQKPFRHGLLGMVARFQHVFSTGVERLVAWVYPPLARPIISVRYGVVGASLAFLIVTFALVAGGRLRFEFLPKIESDVVRATVTMPYGTPSAQTQAVVDRLVDEAHGLLDEAAAAQGASISEGLYARVGASSSGGSGPRAGSQATGSHRGEAVVYMVPMDQRPLGAGEFARRWRERVGSIAGVDTLTFTFSTGPSGGMPVDIQLTHPDIEVLERAAGELAAALGDYQGVLDIDSGFSAGKTQLDVRLRPEGRALGLTETDLAEQLRAAFFGIETVRQQRGRDEVRVYVRWPQAERRSEYDVEEMVLRLPTGGEVLLRDVAAIERGRSYTEIRRRDGRRVVNVTADVDAAITTGNEVMTALRADILPPLMARWPGLTWGLAGEQESQQETMGALRSGMLMALLAMFGLMAIAFRSYAQPLLIMTSIPFGFAGAIYGHLFMGYNLSMMSAFGLVALTGVVVNDSLVFIDAANTFRRGGLPPLEAVIAAGVRRFRPILLTSLTTFLGLAPMLTETSMQARFLIPMAISLAFGVLSTTFIALLFIPSAYMILEDIAWMWQTLTRAIMGAPESEPDLEATASMLPEDAAPPVDEDMDAGDALAQPAE
jgi:multidrug efflux pump subunit AcrB